MLVRPIAGIVSTHWPDPSDSLTTAHIGELVNTRRRARKKIKKELCLMFNRNSPLSSKLWKVLVIKWLLIEWVLHVRFHKLFDTQVHLSENIITVYSISEVLWEDSKWWDYYFTDYIISWPDLSSAARVAYFWKLCECTYSEWGRMCSNHWLYIILFTHCLRQR